MSLSSVLLPLPLAPTTPRRCPGCRTRSRSLSSVLPPSALSTPEATSSRLVRRPDAVMSMPTDEVASSARTSARSAFKTLGLVDPRLGLGGPRLGSAPEPLDLPPDPVGETVAVLGPTLEILGPLFQKRRVAPGAAERTTRVVRRHLVDPVGHPIEKGAIVADDDIGEQPAREQHLLEPEDAVEIEVVGGLVEEQDLGIGGQGGGDGQPFPPPARQLPHRAVRVSGSRADRGRWRPGPDAAVSSSPS